MAEKRIYNPLDKKNLGLSVADALMVENVESLEELRPFSGAGIYAVYYRGEYRPYAPLAARNRDGFTWPIYVGKAVPAGARKGGFGLGVEPGFVLFKRLREHAEAIRQVEAFANSKRWSDHIKLRDFFHRYLLVDDIWIPLGESMMIERYQPLWNKAVDGFGNHDPGKGRYEQQCSAWDTLHAGRGWAAKCQPYSRTIKQILESIDAHFAQWASE